MYAWKTQLDAKKFSQSIQLAYSKCLHYSYSYEDEQSTVNVHWYVYLIEKGPTNSLSPDQKKSPFPKVKKESSCLKVGTPLLEHSLPASSTANDSSSW